MYSGEGQSQGSQAERESVVSREANDPSAAGGGREQVRNSAVALKACLLSRRSSTEIESTAGESATWKTRWKNGKREGKRSVLSQAVYLVVAPPACRRHRHGDETTASIQEIREKRKAGENEGKENSLSRSKRTADLLFFSPSHRLRPSRKQPKVLNLKAPHRLLKHPPRLVLPSLSSIPSIPLPHGPIHTQRHIRIPLRYPPQR